MQLGEKSNLPHGAGHICDVNLSKVAHYMMRQAAKIPSIYNALGLLGSDLPFGEDLDVYRFQTSVEPQPQNIPEPKKERKGP